MDILKLLDRFTGDAIAFRRDIHRHPELGFEEVCTTEQILAALRTYEGVEILPPLLDTGAIAAYIITELQTVISRENYPVTPAVRIVEARRSPYRKADNVLNYR